MKRGKTNPIQRTTPGGGSYGGDFQPKYSTQIFNSYKKQPQTGDFKMNISHAEDSFEGSQVYFRLIPPRCPSQYLPTRVIHGG